jgi:hypothetical protein
LNLSSEKLVSQNVLSKWGQLAPLRDGSAPSAAASKPAQIIDYDNIDPDFTPAAPDNYGAATTSAAPPPPPPAAASPSNDSHTGPGGQYTGGSW